MKLTTLPITEKTISKNIGREIKSPIHVNSLDLLQINQAKFLKKYSKLFKELPWDYYDSRRLQVLFLQENFPKDAKKIKKLFRNYYEGHSKIKVFKKWIKKSDLSCKCFILRS